MVARSGIGYFSSGFSLIRTKGLKRFVLVPLMVNLLLFSVAFYFLYNEIGVAISWLINMIPEWLGWLKTVMTYILWPIAVLSVLLVFGLIFGTLANWIAAPFNGILAEKVERHLTGQDLGDEGVLSLIKDIPRTLGREAAKFWWYLPRAIGFFLIFLLVPVIGQIVWFVFTAWMQAIVYCDYPYDNHKVPFKTMRDHLGGHKTKALSFGMMVNVFSLIPVLNFVVMPIAICGATHMWVNELRDEIRPHKPAPL
ncbi:sulfate transporter CysZ [Salinimonas marina]|uniref:Sulfate transporter CysZ n=1 Tax=Salinimonas marina TaxID=2785918 RepID=A0A7S9DV08_9ALTE|nr:sulfate transporter CysZ [Salinimonas marina]QPG04367.1 sulfate transporter CysZ [Salinimonas marina]